MKNLMHVAKVIESEGVVTINPFSFQEAPEGGAYSEAIVAMSFQGYTAEEAMKSFLGDLKVIEALNSSANYMHVEVEEASPMMMKPNDVFNFSVREWLPF